MNAKEWLRAVKLDRIAEDIELLEARWKEAGARTRRDWWAVLAGSCATGKPVRVDEYEFPVMAAVRARQGLPPVKVMWSTKGLPAPPPPVVTKRWPR